MIRWRSSQASVRYLDLADFVELSAEMPGRGSSDVNSGAATH